MKRVQGMLMAVLLLGTPACAQSTDRRLYGLQDQKTLQDIVRTREPQVEKNPNDVENLKQVGIAYHNLGRQEVSGSVPKALTYLQRARDIAPQDYELLAYLGSAKTMEARDSWNPVTKTLSVEKGMRWLDDAVDKAPDNVAVRFVRIYNSLRLPRIFNRVRYAKTDLLHLMTLVEKNPSAFEPTLQAEIFFLLGEVSTIEDEGAKAQEYWRKAVNIAPDSEWAQQAKKRL